MRRDTDLVGKQAELELVYAACKLNGQCGHRSAAVHVEWYQMHSRDVQMRVRMTWASGAETRATSLWPASQVCSGVSVSCGKRGKKKYTPICAVSVYEGAGSGQARAMASTNRKDRWGNASVLTRVGINDCNQLFRLFFEALVARDEEVVKSKLCCVGLSQFLVWPIICISCNG